LNKKNTEVQEFRSSGVQNSSEREDLPEDRSDLTGEPGSQSPTLKNFSGSLSGGA